MLAFGAGALKQKASSLRKTPKGDGNGGEDGSPASFGGRARSTSAPSIAGGDGMFGELQRRMASIRYASSREEEHQDSDSDDGFD